MRDHVESRPSLSTRFGILGPLLVRGGHQQVAITGRRPQAVLACLLLERGRTLSDEVLIDAVYGGRPPRSARNQIQQAVHHLRRLGVPVSRSGNGYALSAADTEIDAFAFQSHVRRARGAVQDGLLEEAATQFGLGFGLWRGEALTGFDTPYFREAAAALEESRLTALADHVETQLELGRPHEAIPDLRKAVAENPLRERFHSQLMLALYRDGRQSDALEVFRSLRLSLAEELGVDPSPDLNRLHQRILTQDPSLGHVRAASSSGSPGSAVPRQLPPGALVLNGREAELRKTRRALTWGGCPVVVLAGFGGTGKTALALHAAHAEADSFPDGQLFAKLVGDHALPVPPEEVLGMFLRALGLHDSDVPVGLQERAALFRTQTAGKRILVVLDDARTLKQIRPLLPSAAGCAVIITTPSWEVIQPEWELIKVDPLGPADARSLLERSVGRDLLEAEPQALQEVLDRCGGLPLALEIVAVRMASGQASVRRIAERLADRDRLLEELTAGDRTVRAVLEVGYRALDAEPRSLLRKIGLFGHGEFTVDMAAALGGTSATDAEYLLEDLTDAHFLFPARATAPGEVTYRCHDMVLAFGHELSLAEDTTEARAAALERAYARLMHETRQGTPVRRTEYPALTAACGPPAKRMPSSAA
ncbi:AfsR/SARP family transcriptional regulator [Streptomyces swartbergensis]|uniref:AfsR/SARP family transcriptional regulator n=1 Tax=Streptomyces swartbergensis TaxID=487165 RepID=UPI00117E8F26|nr:AfsR/SARP family transcriptional regulator [Streptomyces swartbergensis]